MGRVYNSATENSPPQPRAMHRQRRKCLIATVLVAAAASRLAVAVGCTTYASGVGLVGLLAVGAGLAFATGTAIVLVAVAVTAFATVAFRLLSSLAPVSYTHLTLPTILLV